MQQRGLRENNGGDITLRLAANRQASALLLVRARLSARS
jgi:hypothetical protein